MKEKNKIKIFCLIIAVVAVFGNSAIEFLGKAQCFAVANLVGEIFAPVFGAMAVVFFIYFFWYFLWNVPKKIYGIFSAVKGRKTS